MKKNIYWMYLIGLLQGMVFYGPVATLYRQAQGVTVFQITFIESISLVLCVVLEIPWGIIADKIGYRRTMILCCFVYGLSKIVFWQADGFGWFLLERIMLSVVISGMSGTDTSILYLSCKEGESQKVFGIYNSLQTVGLLAAAGVYSVFIGDRLKLAGGLTVVSYGLAAVASLGLVEVRPCTEEKMTVQKAKEMITGLFRRKRVLLLLLAAAFLTETHQTVTVFLNQLQYVKCGMSTSAIGAVFVLVTIAGLTGAYSWRVCKKTGERAAGLFFFVLAAASCMLLAFTDLPVVSVAGILILRIADSLFEPLSAELQNREVVTGNRATELSVYAMFIDCVGAGTNLVFGAFAEIHLSAALLFGTGLCMAGLILFYIYFCFIYMIQTK